MKGLAYVDFSDEEHLAAAVAKNKQFLLGKKLSIARSDPKRGRKESSGPRNFKEPSKCPYTCLHLNLPTNFCCLRFLIN